MVLPPILSSVFFQFPIFPQIFSLWLPIFYLMLLNRSSSIWCNIFFLTIDVGDNRCIQKNKSLLPEGDGLPTFGFSWCITSKWFLPPSSVHFGKGIHLTIVLLVMGWLRLYGSMTTLDRFIGVQGSFTLNFLCRLLCVFSRSETAVSNILFNGIVSPTNATDLAKKMLREYHFMGLNSSNSIICSWCHLVPHRRKDPVWL